MNKSIWTAFIWLFSAAFSLAYAQPHPQCPADPWQNAQPAGPRITNVTASGNGCPAATWCPTARYTTDQWFRYGIDFLAYKVTPDRFSDAPQTRSCTVEITVENSTPVQFALNNYSFTGLSFLRQGERGNVSVSLGMVGMPANLVTSDAVRLEGPTPQNGQSNIWQIAKAVPLQWSPCSTSRTFVLNLTAFLDARDPNSYLEFYQAVNEMQTKGPEAAVSLATRQCSSAWQ